MIKQISLLMLLVLFLSGCKIKKYTGNRKSTKETQISSRPKTKKSRGKKYDTNGGLYQLPADTGKFEKFPIASIQEYISTFSEIAQQEMKAYGIPASITLAQGILESGFGKSELTLKTNNHFGIKCHNNWEGDYDFHDDDAKGECFRKYNHPMFSYRDHSIFLSSRSRYAFLFELRTNDYKGWAKGLRRAGYATDKKYPQKLISFIERYELYTFDEAVLKGGGIVPKQPKTYELRTHIVGKGDTLYSISQKYFISVPDLMKLNNLEDTTLSVGQRLQVKSEKVNK